MTGVTYQVSRDGGVSWTDDTSGSGADSTVTNTRSVLAGSLEAGRQGSVSFTVTVE